MIEKYKMKEKLQRAEKFYIASELAASIAHEIHKIVFAAFQLT
jgi:two-component system sporulation sensor kinase B